MPQKWKKANFFLKAHYKDICIYRFHYLKIKGKSKYFMYNYLFFHSIFSHKSIIECKKVFRLKNSQTDKSNRIFYLKLILF